MVLEIGEKVHIIERRYFQEDIRRHFVGEVLKCTENTIRLRGYAWVFDNLTRDFFRQPELRERVLHFGDRLTVNVIPKEVSLEEIKYARSRDKGLLVTDGKKFKLNITEFAGLITGSY
jgi:hypothetical protein